MFQNYFITAIRNIIRQKGYTLINVSGLAIGMASCLLIVLFILDEISYDRFHEKGDRIYRLLIDYTSPNGEKFSHAIGPYRLAPELLDRYPEIEEAVRLSVPFPTPVKSGEVEFTEDFVSLADEGIFRIFSFDLVKGDAATALAEPFTCIISSEMAGKFFGDDDPLDKTLTVPTPAGEGEARVTGVFNSFPGNSHLHPDMLISMATAEYVFNDRQKLNYGEGTVATYLLMPGNFKKESLESQFPVLLREIFSDENADERARYWLQSLYDIHLRSDLRRDFESGGDIGNIYIFSIVALFLLVIAAINYMNLATARSARRGKEVGLRKVVGAHRFQLILQFIGESLILVFISMLLAVVLAQLLLPYFNQVSGKDFKPDMITQPAIVISLIFAVFLVGILAGSYPAFFLSRFKPIKVLAGETGSGRGSLALRKILVVLQFSISTALIISTLVVFSQWNYMSKKKLGVNPENVIILRRPDNGYETFKQEVLKNPEVLSVTSSNKKPATGLTSNLGFRAEGLPEEANKSIKIVTVDFDFFETIENRIVEGRSFSKVFALDSVSNFILNETAVRDIGWEDPVGKWFETVTLDPATNNWKERRGIVVGVAEDFHFESMHNTIQPVCYFVDNFWSNWMSIRIASENMPQTLRFLEDQYKNLNTDFQFEYSFYDDDIQALYLNERQFFRLFIVFAFLAIIIACLGILGLASYTAEQRTREIGIRKAAGASVNRIIFLITNEFSLLVLIANLIAWPVAWYFMRNWLQDFPYKINLGLHIFLLSALLAMLIALLMVGYQAYRAASRNPVDSLRYE